MTLSSVNHNLNLNFGGYISKIYSYRALNPFRAYDHPSPCACKMRENKNHLSNYDSFVEYRKYRFMKTK